MSTQVNIAETNDMLAELYKKAGIDSQGFEQKTEEKVIVKAEDKKEEPISRSEQLLSEIAAAVKPKPVEAEKPKPKTLSQDEMFSVGLELTKGNAQAIDTYLQGTDYLSRELSKHGLTVDDVKKAVAAATNQASQAEIERAANAWMQRQGNDWPGGKANQVLLGATMGRMRLNPSDPESYEKAYQEMKTQEIVVPVKREETGKRERTGSTAFATGAEHGTRKPAQSQTPTISQAKWDKMKPAEQQAMYNDLVSQGYKPEDIKFVA